MKKKLLLSLMAMALSYAGFTQTPFTAGSISVLRVGDGSTALGAVAAPVFIDEYSVSGTLIRSIALPKSSSEVSEGNHMLTMDGSNSNHGLLSLSQDGKKLALVGYNAANGTAAVSATASATVNRVIGLIDGAGIINTQTALGINDTKLVSSAAVNDNDLWVCGQDGSLYYATIGSNTATALLTYPTGSGIAKYNAPVQALRIFDGQLYASRASGTGTNVKGPVVSVGGLGTGLPTLANTSNTGTLTNMPDLDLIANSTSPRDFFFADTDPNIPGVDVLYVTNVTNTLGIVKYSLVNDNGSYKWKENNRYTNGSDQFAGITGVVSGSTVTLYIVKWGTQNNSILKLVDNAGYNANMPTTVTTLVSAIGNNQGFRGISVSPTPPATQPVSLNSFTGKLINDGVQLNWVTTSEQNNDYFEVYHAVDNQNFTAVGRVKGKGNAQVISNYLYQASFVPGTTNYYKLRQVDFNNDYTEYGPVGVYIGLKNDLQFTVKENSVVLYVLAQTETKTQIDILNTSGQKVYSIKTNLTKGTNQIDIPFTQGKGIYVLSVKKGNELTVRKFVK